MKKMIYKPNREIELLDRGIYKEHEYFAVSLGTHPCGYIKLRSWELPEIAENVCCHGGITYNRNYLVLPEGEIGGNFIGWDYAHYMDYAGYNEELGYTDGKRYTTEEIVSECFEVIDQLIDMFEESEVKK